MSVDLVDPTLLALEVGALLLTFAWIFIGATDYLFATRLGRMIRQARAAEKELEKQLQPMSSRKK